MLDLRQIVKDYFEAEEQIKQTDIELAGEVSEITREKYREARILEDKIRLLENEKHTIERKFDSYIGLRKAEYSVIFSEMHEKILKAKRYKAFVNITPVPGLAENSVSQYEEKRFFQWSDYICNDEFARLRLLIAENNKPVKRYSLLVIGYVAFGQSVLLFRDYPWKKKNNYGHTHLNSTKLDAAVEGRGANRHNFIFESERETFETVKEAQDYVARRKEKIIPELVEELKRLKQECLEVQKVYAVSDFDGIKLEE